MLILAFLCCLVQMSFYSVLVFVLYSFVYSTKKIQSFGFRRHSYGTMLCGHVSIQSSICTDQKDVVF